MLTYKELTDLRDKFSTGEIGLERAKEIYWGVFKKEKRSWHTKDWKERKDLLIKEKCEICSSKEILTIQHLSHPQKYANYTTELARVKTKEFIAVNPVIEKSELTKYIQDNYTYVPVPLCPNCNARKPNARSSKIPKYLCTKCHHQFDDPIHITAEELISMFFQNEEILEVNDKCFVTNDKWQNKHNLSNIRYWIQRDNVKKSNLEAIEKEAFLMYLNDNVKYLSFEDTITACKKCAAYFDLHNMKLCPNCKEHYKGVDFPTCIQCLPEDKRKIALEKIEFGKQMSSMEKELGID